MNDERKTKKQLIQECELLRKKVKQLEHKQELSDSPGGQSDDLESAYRGFFENARIGMFRSTADGRFIAANSMLARLLGYEGSEDLLAFKDIASSMYVDRMQRDELLNRLKIASAGSELTIESRVRRRDGSLLWIAENVWPVYDASGKRIESYEGTIQDITHRKETRRENENLSQMFQSIVEVLRLWILQKDVNGKITYINKAYSETMGRREEEILGKTDYDLFPKALADDIINSDHKVMKTGKMYKSLERHLNASGTDTEVEVIKTPRFDEAGHVTGIQSVFWEIDRNERDWQRLIVDSIPNPVFVKEDQFRYVFINNAMADFMGVSSPHDIVGMTDFDIFPSDIADRLRSEDNEVLRTRKPHVTSSRWPRGVRPWMKTTLIPLTNKTGDPIGVGGVSTDITELMDSRNSNEPGAELQGEVIEIHDDVAVSWIDLENGDRVRTAISLELIKDLNLKPGSRFVWFSSENTVVPR